MKKEEISILTVNYNTPGLLEDLLKSIDLFYPDMKVYVVDGSDTKEYVRQTKNLVKNRKNIQLFSLGKNIHHGPGLDYGIKKISSNYILIIDTDSKIIKGGLVECMMENLEDGYGVGLLEYVGNDGRNVQKESGIPYLHPRCALISKKAYLSYKPAIRHGAPMIEAMKDIFEKGDIDKLKNFEMIYDFYFHVGQGTVDQTGGYHLKVKKSYTQKKLINFLNRIKSVIKKILPG